MSVEQNSRVWDWYCRGIGGAVRALFFLMVEKCHPERRDIASLRFLHREMEILIHKVEGVPDNGQNPYKPSWGVQPPR